jgi:hypothetical protein
MHRVVYTPKLALNVGGSRHNQLIIARNSTTQIFKKMNICFSLGFDENQNETTVLMVARYY